MSHVEIIEVRSYYPPGVSEIIGRGGECFVGAIDEFTVLKYPCIHGEYERIRMEAQLLDVLGSHPRIIASKGLTEDGLVLQRASNGSMHDFSYHSRLYLSIGNYSGVNKLRKQSVISMENVSSTGMLKSADGDTLLDGLSRECSKSYQPRVHGDYACVATDLFALGSAIYFIMTGHEVFPELDSWEDDEEILSRFQNGLFPNDNHPCSQITEKCWKQQYRQAAEIVSDLCFILEARCYQEDEGGRKM
ncbi:hypothetical protein N7534_005434 [Penicillium rubens]|nr:hypothetical protein N7534_005434 [Penicillium rubens]